MKQKTAHQKEGITPIIILVVILVVAAALYFAFTANRDQSIPETTPLPPVSERKNPSPDSANIVYVSSVDPGTEVLVTEAKLSEDGYIVVQRENDNGTLSTIGSSDLLKAGSYSNLSITTKAMSDGDAIYISLENTNKKVIIDDNENPIQMMKNVGKLMGHQISLPEGQSYY